jgi:hypothetical protein
MNRRVLYHGQVVTANEINDVFDQVEIADLNDRIDADVLGVQSGFVVSENTVPDLSVKITAGMAYDSDGRRVVNGALVALDLSVDSNNASTDVVTPGNEKWLAIFAVYDLVLSDLRPTLDGNSVYWREDESVTFVVTQGAEAGAGLASKPALVPGYVLIADVLREEGVVAILNAAIDPDPDFDVAYTTRKQFAYRLTSSTPERVLAGTSTEAMQAILDVTNNHISGTSNKHAADAITFDPTGTNFGVGVTNVDLGLVACHVLDAVYPGNLIKSPDRRRTHGANADWRDDAYTQQFTRAGSGEVPAGGGAVDMKIGGLGASDGPDGYIEFEDDGVYLLNLNVGLTMVDPADPNYTYASLVWIGLIQRDGVAVTVLSPSANAPLSVPLGNAVLTLEINGVFDLLVRATCVNALSGDIVRMCSNATVQRVKYA